MHWLSLMILALATVADIGSACAASVPSDQAIHASAIESERQQLLEAQQKIQNSDYVAADLMLTEVVGAATFSSLQSSEQHFALRLAAFSAQELGDNNRAHTLSIRACSMLEATGIDWHFRLNTAYAIDDRDDAVLSLTTIAKRWPRTLTNVNDEAIFNLVDKAKASSNRDDAFNILDALFQANWKVEGLHEPSGPWRDLTVLLIERRQSGKAALVASHITSTRMLVGMRADNRFSALVKADPGRFDIDAAINQETREFRESLKRNPRSLQAVVELADVLIIANKLDEALALADTAIARAKGNDEAAPPYDDVSEWLIWVMDKRANALTSLGRWDEAVEQFVKAGRRPERGSMNVSQAINLSFLYAALDRPMDALAAIDDIGTLSAYGRMQVEAVRHMAAIELNDAAAAEAALAYMREHKADAIETFQKALIRANRLDEASDALIARLNDPDLRNQALISLQNYIEMPATGRETEWATRSASVAHTPKVLAAIKKFGKIERYNLAPE